MPIIFVFLLHNFLKRHTQLPSAVCARCYNLYKLHFTGFLSLVSTVVTTTYI